MHPVDLVRELIARAQRRYPTADFSAAESRAEIAWWEGPRVTLRLLRHARHYHRAAERLTGEKVAVVSSDMSHESNARLIAAAAPEMLALLRDAAQSVPILKEPSWNVDRCGCES